MKQFAPFFAMLLCLLTITSCSASKPTPTQTPTSTFLRPYQSQLLGSPIYIQIFKQERQLELYAKTGDKFQLIKSFPICNYSGGLGPKHYTGDLKSPEGFYSVRKQNLKPDSRFYRAINIGYPNEYDRSQGYTGSFLMIHGNCKSIGCYAMTDAYMGEIYRYADAAFAHGQQQVQISIYPFRMTAENLQRYKYSNHMAFWRQLKPGYDYFVNNQLPPTITVVNGQYALGYPAANNKPIQYASSSNSTHNTNPFVKTKQFTITK